MSYPITLDPGAEAVLRGLQPLFAPYGTVTPVHLKTPNIVMEFRHGGVKDTDLADVPKPALDWAFAVDLDVTPDGVRLCAMLFSKWSRLTAFYNANPALHGTLITCWNSGAAIWLRVAGRLPRDFEADGARWCMSGVVPVGCPKQPAETFISQAGEIKRVEFNKLVWTEQQEAEVERLLLEAEVGPPFRVVARGRRVLNLSFWAKYFTGLMPISFDPDRDVFTWGDGKVREPVLLTTDQTITEFTRLLQAVAPSLGANFPQGEIKLARVRQLVERVKALTLKPRLSDHAALDSFLKDIVHRIPGKDVSVHELFTGYTAYCHAHKLVSCSEPRFFRLLHGRLKNLGIDPRHDILRAGKRVRGYTARTLKATVLTNNPDVSDVSDAPDGADGA